jgi:Transposase DDE domain
LSSDDALRHLFESVVQRCMAEGLVGAEGFAVDASLIAADANKQRSIPSKDWRPEELEKKCGSRRARISRHARRRGVRRGLALKFISRSDPAAQWTGAHKGHAFFAYAVNYLIDTDHGVIVDVEATRAIRQAEVGAAQTMLERTGTRFGVKPDSLTADSAYGSAESLAWLVKQKGITPLIPVFDKPNRADGTFSRADFPFDPECDRYTCPAGKELVQFRRTYATPRSGVTAEGTRLYRASTLDCDVCELKAQCCPNAVARKIPRDVHEDARDVARALAATPEYEAACRLRNKVEMLFAHLKRILRLARLRLRGPNGARDEFLLAATAQNQGDWPA